VQRIEGFELLPCVELARCRRHFGRAGEDHRLRAAEPLRDRSTFFIRRCDDAALDLTESTVWNARHGATVAQRLTLRDAQDFHHKPRRVHQSVPFRDCAGERGAVDVDNDFDNARATVHDEPAGFLRRAFVGVLVTHYSRRQRRRGALFADGESERRGQRADLTRIAREGSAGDHAAASRQR